jgi:hypothetical protein
LKDSPGGSGLVEETTVLEKERIAIPASTVVEPMSPFARRIDRKSSLGAFMPLRVYVSNPYIAVQSATFEMPSRRIKVL